MKINAMAGCRRRRRLKGDSTGGPCPLSKTPPEELSWIYLVIPSWAGKDTEEKEGLVTICDRCKLQIDFFAKSD